MKLWFAVFFVVSSFGFVRPARVAAFDPEAATGAWLAKVPAAEKARSDAYFEGGYWLQLWSFLIGLAVAWLMLARGSRRACANGASAPPASARCRPASTPSYTCWSLRPPLPLDRLPGLLPRAQVRPLQPDFGEWMWDLVKGLLWPRFGALGLMALYAVLRRAPRTWWLWGSVVVVALLVFVVVITPVYISPLFNTYEPLDPTVRDPILRWRGPTACPLTTSRSSTPRSRPSESAPTSAASSARAGQPQRQPAQPHLAGRDRVGDGPRDRPLRAQPRLRDARRARPDDPRRLRLPALRLRPRVRAGARAGASPASTTRRACRCWRRCSRSSSFSPRRWPTPSSAATRRRPTSSVSTPPASLTASPRWRSSSASTASSSPGRSRR